MVGSTRAELASSSLDGSTFGSSYPSGPRGTYTSPSLERPGSFRESLENRLMASTSGASRNASPSLDTPPLSQYLSLEPFSTSELNLKYSRQGGELRRALGVSVEEHSFGSLQSKTLPPIASEELKRFKANVLETSARARDRAKLLQESILKLDKYRNLFTKRRLRNDAQTSEKPASSNLLKMGNQIHQSNSDIANARPEERTKLAIPNRRVRSSMAESEGRSTIPARQGAAIDKDKNMFFEKDKSMLRGCNGGPMPSEDRIRGLPTGGDGWEKKLKRKRSVGTMGNRIPDGDRELKQAIQLRPNTESRSRPPDGNGFRSGSANGVMGSSKTENNSQICGNSSRVMPRNELENGSFPNDRGNRITGVDKERIMAKGSNKLNNREDSQPESESPPIKGKASRAPRTGSGILVGAPNYPRLSGAIEGWEQPPCLNKVQPLNSPANRKRQLPTGSSSPPVTQWVGQRPQKISRTRRANVVSPVSNFDDVQAFSEAFVAPDVPTRLSSVDSGSSLNSRVAANGSHQLKLRLENVPSPAGLSESEESGFIENKREKGGGNGEGDDGHPNLPLKVSDFSLPSKKNKIRPKEEIGDGVRRQGRSGRGSNQSKACLSLTKEKQENADTIKPIKNGRPTSDRSESRVGRPPSKKVSDRKAYGRPVPSMRCGSSDLIGEADDDREELLTAINATRNSSYNNCSSSFWRAMETVFGFASSEDLTFVRRQITFAEEVDESLSSMLDTEHNLMGNLFCGSAFVEQPNQSTFLGMNSFIDTICSTDEPKPAKVTSRKTQTESWFDRIIPLSQRLLSALISEDGTESLNSSGEQEFLQISSDCSAYGTTCYFENESESAAMKLDFELVMDYTSQKNCAADVKSCNGFVAHSNNMTSVLQTSISGGHLFQENGVSEHLDAGALPEYGHCNSLQFSGAGLTKNSSYECQFEHMPLNDRILLELHSIGIYPDLVPGLAEGEDEEIDRVISDLKIKFLQQARKRKSELYKLEKALQGVKQVQERNIEQLAMHKLVEMAYKRLMGGRGSHGSSHKSGVSKISKQLARDFAKRTLMRYNKFEETGQSCLSDPPMRDVLFSALQHCIESRYSDGLASNNVDRNGPKSERAHFISFQGPSNMADQVFAKNDPFSNRGKKKEALLDDVVTSAASRAVSTPYNMVPVGSKWKKTDKDKDHSRDVPLKPQGAKAGRPSLSGSRGERKTKTKPKQKIAQLSTSGTGLSRPSETNLLTSGRPSSGTANNGGINISRIESHPSHNVSSELAKDLEDSIFTSLPLNGMIIDELDVAAGLGGQGQDIGSWLNVDEDALQDHDLVGLEIPMDDLSELKLNF